MIVAMQESASEEQIQQVIEHLVKMGFEVREPLAVITGTPLQRQLPDCKVREAINADVARCAEIHFLDT